MQNLEISCARPEELENVDAFYRKCGYRGGVSDEDITLIAKHHEELIGVVRLCPESGFTVLRGMQIGDRYQRRGVGSELLLQCVPYLDQRPAFCLPYRHLVAFYRRVGFVQANAAELPAFLADRLHLYNCDGKEVLAMQRGPADFASLRN